MSFQKLKRFSGALTVASINTAAMNAVELVRAAQLDDTTLGAITDKIAAAAEEQNNAIKRDKVYSGLEALDGERDALSHDVVELPRTFLRVPVEEISAAAAKIVPVVDKYGLAITKAPYAEETALIRSLKTDLSAPELADAVKALPGYAVLTERLWAKNEEFNARAVENVSAAPKSTRSASAVKKELVHLLNEVLLPYVEAASEVRSDLDALAAKLADLINKSNAAAK